jgi:hypothetical protein
VYIRLTMNNNITIGDTVRRAPEDRFNAGERGQVVEVDTEKLRARVLWTTCLYNGQIYSKNRPKRTWVNIHRLAAVEQA